MAKKNASKIELVARDITVWITPTRRAEIGTEIADATDDLGALLAAREIYLGPSKEQEKELRSSIQKAARTLRQGYEVVRRQLRPEPDFVRGVMTYLDPETGEELATRPLAEEERQIASSDLQP